MKPKRKPAKGSVFLSDVVAGNVREWRQGRELSQTELARRMRALGHEWVQRTASEAERGIRSISIDELAGLALVLGATVPELVDVSEESDLELDYGHPDGAMPARAARAWLRGERRIAIVDVDESRKRHRISFRVEDAALRLLAEGALLPPAAEEGR